jgi:uncharacterized protein YdaL
MGGRHGVPPPAARIEISREEIREREEDAVELIRKRIKERGELKRIRTSKFEATAPYCGKRSMGNRFFGCHTGFWFFLAVAHQSSMVFFMSVVIGIKMIVFCISCLRWTALKINFIFGVARLTQPT